MAHPVVWFEIGCRDLSATSRFFADLFDWKTSLTDHAAMIDTGSGEGISGHISALGHEPHNYVTVYVQVDDLAANIDKAVALGGKALVAPTEVPGMGHFAWIADPEGTPVGLWKPRVRA